MKEGYVITIRDENTNDILNLTYDNEKDARKAFHNSVSTYGLEFVTVAFISNGWTHKEAA
tara:strand:- start:1679 stop:1858 length:180 start_codon:yes stop_codon:yes gene_type:complete